MASLKFQTFMNAVNQNLTFVFAAFIKIQPILSLPQAREHNVRRNDEKLASYLETSANDTR